MAAGVVVDPTILCLYFGCPVDVKANSRLFLSYQPAPLSGGVYGVKGNAPSTSSHINCERVGETDGRCLAGPVSVCVSALENAMILK